MSDLNTYDPFIGVDVVDDTFKTGDLLIGPYTLRNQSNQSYREREVKFTLSSGVILPSGTTAEASTMTFPQPLIAIEPRWTKW